MHKCRVCNAILDEAYAIQQNRITPPGQPLFCPEHVMKKKPVDNIYDWIRSHQSDPLRTLIQEELNDILHP